jgi:hypothetical protein
MPKVTIITPERARDSAMPPGFSRDGATHRAQAYCNREADPIHLYLHRLGQGEDLRIGPLANDCLAYVWHGAVQAGEVVLATGSSVIIEHGQCAHLQGAGAETQVLTFSGSAPARHGRAGGHVHLLPAECVPYADLLSPNGGVSGGIHSDGQCPTCEVWLHENRFAPADPAALNSGIHSHSESEVIFITEGSIRLGQKLFPAGTAIAIAADTYYQIAPGPEGMSFVNFRAGTPRDIRFADGRTMSETRFWQERLPRPEYLELQVA